MKKAIISASFDPITKGHLYMIERALQIFDHILIGVKTDSSRKYTFQAEDRENLTRKILAKYGDRITIKSYKGILSDFANENQIKTIILKARNTLEIEKIITDLNLGLYCGIDTYILLLDHFSSFLNASHIKELHKNQARNIITYIPSLIKQALEFKISNQYLIGIIGGIGAGKTYVTKKIVALNDTLSPHQDCKISYIDFNEIGQYILRDSEETVHQDVREEIATNFGRDILNNNKIEIEQLLSLFLDDPQTTSIQSTLEKIIVEPIMHIVHKKLIELQGIVLINSALFIKKDFSSLVNNNFILIDSADETRNKRLSRKGYTEQQINNRIHGPFVKKTEIEIINKTIQDESCGNIFIYENEDDTHSGYDRKIRVLHKTLINDFLTFKL